MAINPNYGSYMYYMRWHSRWRKIYNLVPASKRLRCLKHIDELDTILKRFNYLMYELKGYKTMN